MTNVQTHTISLPPMTDVQELLGQYLALFSTLGVVVTTTFVPSVGFSHPIPEENEKLTRQFFDTMNTFKSLMFNVSKITLTNSRVQNTTVTFVFDVEQ